MAVKEHVASAMRSADRRVQAISRFSPSIQRFIRVIVILASMLVTLIFLPAAGGLGFAALVSRDTPLGYASLATVGVMIVLIGLLVRFKKKAYGTLGSITDLSSLTEYLFDELFEALQEGVAALGAIVILLGIAAGAGATLLGHAWMFPVALTLVGAGVIELGLGSLMALAFRKLVGERLRVKAQEAIQWATEHGSPA